MAGERGDAQKHKKGSPWKLTEGVDCFQCGKQKHQKGMSCVAKGIKCGGINHIEKVYVKSGNATCAANRSYLAYGQSPKTPNDFWYAQSTSSRYPCDSYWHHLVLSAICLSCQPLG